MTRPCPADFIERAATMSRNELAEHYRTSGRVLRRWFVENGQPAYGSRDQRPMPADFTVNAAVMRDDALRHRYGASPATVARWREDAGIQPPPRRERQGQPAPEGFAETAARLSYTDCAAKYGASKNTLYRWAREAGIAFASKKRRAAPADFAKRYRSQSVIELAKHYVASRETVMRWAREAGIARPVGVVIERPKAVPFKRVAAPKTKLQRGPSVFAPTDRVIRDMTQAGQAADFLRRFGPVVRCDAAGRYKPDGDHWRRGSNVLSAEEVLERAKRQGFDPSAWTRIAA